MTYDFENIEHKWQNIWDENKTFQAEQDSDREKYYVLEMFPYPSGKIHVGHLRNYTLGDVVARVKKMQGYNVLHPTGWDAFGLPAENAAIASNSQPSDWTYQNIAQMKKQLQQMGLSYDWSREIATCDEDYYGAEQKFFLDFLNAGLVYRKETWVNWDPIDMTVLANEQVVDGKGWRSGADVERKKLTQWFLKITEFADELLADLDTLTDWPHRVTLMQEKWIGRSEGATIFFDIVGRDDPLEVYTTRPDTIFGASFCGISPHHPLAIEMAKNNPKLDDFIKECDKLGTSEEAIETAEKKGVDTGLRIAHPFIEGKELPLYVANFILMDYGTGAIFACPAHDQRDLDFARKYGLEVIPVIQPLEGELDAETLSEYTTGLGKSVFNLKSAYTGEGTLINSEFLNGKTIQEAKKIAIEALVKKDIGERKINYRLRDWGVSRQRYWGCPIPIIHCESCGVVPVPDADLPVALPKNVNFEKAGNPLEHHPKWKNVKCPACGIDAVRETDTLDTFFESSWYFAKFCTPKTEVGIDKTAAKQWLPVDTYIGGIEHAVLHLLYSRFFTRALKKCGYVDVKEPFKRLLAQGMVCLETYKDAQGKYVFPEEVVKEDGKFVHIQTGEEVTIGRSEKMSKSKKNVVNPIDIIEKYGADTARLFMVSDTPAERDMEWSDGGVEGAYRYLKRIWNLVEPFTSDPHPNPIPKREMELPDRKLKSLIHKTIAGVTQDLDELKYNTAVAKIRELSNALANNPDKEGIEVLLKLLNPVVPHITEELWHKMGHETLLAEEAFPVADKALLEDDTATIAVQVNGKLRATIEIAKGLPKDEVEAMALKQENVQKFTEGKEIRKVIVVPNKIVNIVVG